MIVGLTDRGPQFPQIGVLRKGAPRPEHGRAPGKDLAHFRFDSDDADACQVFADAYGDEPRRVNVYLPYATTEENFETCKEAWNASALLHRCNGETCLRYLSNKDGRYYSDPIPCPGGCKPVGRLKVIIPELRRMVYVVAETHSIHDIINLQQQLTALEMLRGSLRGIPMILSRYPREISTPRDDGKRARVTKWLLSIEAAPSWVELQLTAMERQALPVSAPQLALPAPTMQIGNGQIVDMESGEIGDEESNEYHGTTGKAMGRCPRCDVRGTIGSDLGDDQNCLDTKGCTIRQEARKHSDALTRLKRLRDGLAAIGGKPGEIMRRQIKAETLKQIETRCESTRAQIVMRIEALSIMHGGKELTDDDMATLEQMDDNNLIATGQQVQSDQHQRQQAQPAQEVSDPADLTPA